MTEAEKRTFLESYKEKEKRCAEIRETIKALESQREKITSVFSDMPQGHGNDSKLQTLTERIFEIKSNLVDEQFACAERMCDILIAINSLKDTAQRNVMTYRYILCRSSQEAAKHFHVSEAWIFDRQKEAISEIEFTVN